MARAQRNRWGLRLDAMILAAGAGTRLRPMTDRVPKALVEVGGKPLLAWVATRLVDAGADRLIINIHHHADQIRSFVTSVGNFGVDVKFSFEPEGPLETGGGLAAATPHFRGASPFFIHNSDIITEIDLRGLYAAHEADADALVTLAVGGRESWRYLIFDEKGLCGHGNERTGERGLVREPRGEAQNLPFTGVHVADSGLLNQLTETGKFSIISTYLRLAREGTRIAPYDIGGALWMEVGNPNRLAQARAWADSGGTG